MKTTSDAFLGGKVTALQPATGLESMRYCLRQLFLRSPGNGC